jgi:uncharacterized repeat protein (TIGR03803 family)
MTSCINNAFSPLVLAVGFGSLLVGQSSAQTFATLHDFSALSGTPFTNGDGAGPLAAVNLSGTRLYGSAAQGGSGGYGTVFSLNGDGTEFKTIYSFTGCNTNEADTYTNRDGATPRAALLCSGNTLYGTATFGGHWGNGTIFRVNIDGSGFTNLHDFSAGSHGTYGTNTDGLNPNGCLVLWGNTLFGVATYGGNSGNGAVFRLNTDGSGFTNIHDFTATPSAPYGNDDGAGPYAGLLLSSNTLYGTAEYGGRFGYGTLFKMNPDGTGFTTLHDFSPLSGPFFVNSDGANPTTTLTLLGSTLYGTAAQGGSAGYGTVFSLNVDGTGFQTLHSFTTESGFSNINNDGANPRTGLVFSEGTLFGAAQDGGAAGNGTVFKLNPDGSGFIVLHAFAATADFPAPQLNADGVFPFGLSVSGGTLYGTAASGGGSGNGTVFSISLPRTANPPQLAIIPANANVILTWPTNAVGFVLQSTTNLQSPLWTTNSAPPVVINGQNTVTNPFTGAEQFFRLSTGQP